MTQRPASDDLAYIRKIMEESRAATVAGSLDYLVWGGLITFALVVNYAAVLTQNWGDWLTWLWIGAVSSGWIFSLINGFMRKNREPVSFSGRLIMHIWASIGILITLFGFLGPFTGAFKPVYIPAFIATTLSVAYWMTAVIQQRQWLRGIALLWLASGTVMMVLPSVHNLLIMALTMVTGQLIPGIILMRASRNE